MYLKWITNKELLDSTGNSAQWYMAVWMGGEFGGEWIHVYVWLSLGEKQFSSVQSLSHVPLFVTPWTAAHQASLSITNSQSLPKLMFFKSVMPSNHLILLSSPFPPAFNLSQHQGLFK